jgi:hypothetical protein
VNWSVVATELCRQHGDTFSGPPEVALSVVEVLSSVTENVGWMLGTAALHFRGPGSRLSSETGYRDGGFPCLHVQANGKAMTAFHILASSWPLPRGRGLSPRLFRVGYVLVRVALTVSFHQCISLTVCNLSSWQCR